MKFYWSWAKRYGRGSFNIALGFGRGSGETSKGRIVTWWFDLIVGTLIIDRQWRNEN